MCAHVCVCVCVCVSEWRVVRGDEESGFAGMSSLARIVLSVGQHTLVCIYHYAST